MSNEKGPAVGPIVVYENANVTRISIITDKGMVFEKYDLYESGVEIHLQDEGRTLKVFPRRKEGT